MPCHILCTENRYQMKLTPPLALAFLALTSLSTAQTGQATAQEAGDQAPPTAEEDKAQVLDLQEELNHILSRTQNAHQQVTRTFELMDSLKDLEDSGTITEETGVKARKESLRMLVDSLNELQVKALEIHDKINGETLIEMKAMEARLEVNLEQATDEFEREQLTGLLGQARQNRTEIYENVVRLAGNIEGVKDATRRLGKQLGYLDLVEGVVATGQKVGDSLNKLNEGMEQIIRELTPQP